MTTVLTFTHNLERILFPLHPIDTHLYTSKSAQFWCVCVSHFIIQLSFCPEFFSCCFPFFFLWWFTILTVKCNIPLAIYPVHLNIWFVFWDHSIHFPLSPLIWIIFGVFFCVPLDDKCRTCPLTNRFDSHTVWLEKFVPFFSMFGSKNRICQCQLPCCW